MARIKDVVFDSPHPASIARFWAQVLDEYRVAAYDEAELTRLRALGIEDINDDPTVVAEPAGTSAQGGRGIRLFFQLVPETKIVKNRVHLDISAADLAAELGRLVSLGARVQAVHDGWTTLSDPDGNEFCLTRG
jgi:glyoxalase superfamily protein